MIKKLIFLFITLSFSMVATAEPLRFEQGVHYDVIGDIGTAKPTLTEYFSYFCGHCYRLENTIKEVEKMLPEGAVFEKSHVDFVGRAPTSVQFGLNKAVVVAEKMGVAHKVTDALFDYIHVQKKQLTSEAQIKALFSLSAADEIKFDKLIKSFGVKGAASRMKKMQDELSARQALTEVPMLVVNGKYKILYSALRSRNDYAELLSFLLAMK